MRRALLFCAAIAFAIACGDSITEPVPNRTVATPPIAFATTTTEDGLSISTDKDDYAPGDTVHFTGSGWQPGDVLDIVLTDDPLTHDPHTWSVDVGEDGIFHDSTYVVDEGDLDVTFTLVATSRATGRSLTVVFTDGAPTVSSFTLNGTTFTFPASPPNANATNPITVTTGATVTLQLTGATVGGNPGRADWKSTDVGFSGGAINFGDTPPRVCNDVDLVTDNTPQAVVHSFTFSAPTTAGTYIVRVRGFIGDGCTGTSGSLALNGVLIVKAATSTAVTSSQNPSIVGNPVTFTATVTSGSPAEAVTTGSVTFRDGTCAAGTILGGPTAVDGSGQAIVSTSALSLGSHTIRGCYGGATGFLASEGSVTQQVNNTATDLALISSVNPSVTGQSSTFTATVTNNSNPVTTGEVIFKKGGNDCSDATLLQAGQTPNGSGEVTYAAAFAASQSPVTIRACYGGSTTPLLGASEAALVQTVNKADQTITFNPNPLPGKTYGDAAFTVTATASSGLAVAFEVGATDNCTISGNTVTITGAGSCTVTAKQDGDDDWNPAAAVSRPFTIDPRPIKVKANDAGPTYYGNTPTFGYTLTGNFIGSDEAAFAATLSYGLSGTLNSDNFRDVGTYTITPIWTYSNSNYAISLASPGTGTLTIVARPISIKADDAGPIVYGTATPTSFTYTLTGNFVVPADLNAFAATLSYAVGGILNSDGFLNVGNYPITPSWTYSNTNYAISLTTPKGALTVDPRPITIKANNAGPIYYDDPLPTFTWSIVTGNFIGSDQAAFALTVTFELSPPGSPLPVGPHTITPVWTYSNSNYAISLANPGTGTITVQAWTLRGFYQPVDMAAGGMIWNTVKGGFTVPLKFEVFAGSTEKTDIAIVKFFTQKANCPADPPTDAIEIVTTGGTTLRYDASAGQFVQNWQTPKAANICYVVTMTTQDGSSIVANFKTKS